jgi:Ca2+-binding RTX toxin-like protein
MATWTGFLTTSTPGWGQDGITGTFDNVNSTSSRAIFNASDGTKTYLNGTNIVRGGTGLFSWTNLSSVQHVAADGTTVLEQITGIDPAITGENGHLFSDPTIGILKGDDTLTGSSGNDHFWGQGGANTFFGGAGADSMNGGPGADTFRLTAGDFVAGEGIGGGSGDTLQLENAGNVDLRIGTVSVEIVKFFSGTSAVTIDGPAAGSGTSFKTFIGSAQADALTVTGVAGVNLSSTIFTSWTPGQDTITLQVGGGNFGSVTGTVQNDIFTFNQATIGSPTLNGNAGDDTFVFSGTSNGGFDINGGIGTDTIKTQNVTLDFTNVTIASIESLVFDTGASTVTFSQAQLDAGVVPAITGSANVDAIVIGTPVFTGAAVYNEKIDASALVLTSWTEGVDTITLTDTINNGATAFTGSSHRDTIMGNNGPDSLNGKGGADRLFGGTQADKFVFDAVAMSDAQSAIFDTVKDYNQGNGAYEPAEGDQIDLSALLSTAYNHGSGQPVASLVRAVEDAGGTFAKLQIDADGTANGVNWTTIARLDGLHTGNNLSIILDSSLPAGSTIAITSSLAKVSDFNNDSFSDILFRNNSTGDTGYTDIHNNVFHSLGGSPVAYSVVGLGDYNGDSFSDILFRNNSTGDTGYTDLHNNVFHSLGGSPAAYGVVGSGDYNGDGFSDILFRNNSTGDTGYTDLHNNIFHSLGGSPTAYGVVGSGDYNGDGFSDILFRNNATGDTGYTDLHNNVFHSLGGSPVAYSVIGSGDYNGDGFSDILFRNNSTGDTGYTDLHNNVFHSLGGSPVAWSVVGSGDYNGDSFSDILFRNNSTGDTGYTDIHNNVFHSLGGSPAAYLVMA